MRKNVFVIMALFAVGSVLSCSFGLKKDAKDQGDAILAELKELNVNLKEVEGLKTEIHILNENLENMKPTTEKQTDAMLRVAEVLESINSKLDKIPKKFLSP